MSRYLKRYLHTISSSIAPSRISRLIVARPSLISARYERFAPSNAFLYPFWSFRNISHGSVSVVISQGKLKFETQEVDPPKKEKWTNKKKFKLQKLREKRKRKLANKKDPRRLTVRGKKKKHRFANAEERLKFKIEKAKIKEAMLIERLQRYEVSKLQGPVVKPHEMTGEERFYMKKMAQKGSNYVPVGRRGIFGGVILNMHMHWKKHETVKVICKPCKPGQIHEYAEDIARLSGGVPIHIIGEDTIVFYRGKDYVMPRVMSPIDTLSKKRALEKSKYEQSLDTVRHFIAISEKELELYYRHIALYGDPNNRNPMTKFENEEKCTKELPTFGMLEGHHITGTDDDSEVDYLSISELESESEDESDAEDQSSNEPV